MKLDLDMSVVSRFLRGLLNEFGQKKLWPVAALLLAGIVAVPVLLSSSSSPTPVAQAPLPAPPPPPGASIPTLNVQSTPNSSRPTGPSHNPFAQSGTSNGAAAVASPSSSVSPVTSSAGNGAGAPTGASSSPSSGSSFPSSTRSGSSPSSGGIPATTPPSITGNAKPKPAPAGLSSTQSYGVRLAITNFAGGVDTIDPLVRLRALPSDQQPLVVELGVLMGGRRVLFAVQPGTVVKGPGSCIPGPIDCEILSLRQNQTESVSSRDSGANALFAVTGITAVSHSSVAAAKKAREAKSAAGQAALDRLSLPALSLFKYEPSLGSIVDLRDLGVN